MVAHHRLCTSPIIGIDLLSSSNLLVDLMARRLVDLTTNYHTSGTLTNAPMKSVSTLSDDRYFRGLLMRFVSVITVSLKHSMACVTHSVKHHIETNFHRRSTTTKEVYFLLGQGICRPSKSCWASPLHMVSKRSGGWRACRD